MRAHPDRDFRTEGNDFGGLRAMNMSGVLRPQDRCCWAGLVDDLENIFRTLQPTVVVLPCPRLDSHVDHQAVVQAVGEAVGRTNAKNITFLLYVNHAAEAELWPYGPAETDMALPPVTASPYPVYGVCSRPLTLHARNMKFLLLEAMHDLRDAPSTEKELWRKARAEIRGELAAKIRGLERSPNGYLRRAIRQNELFFVANYAQLQSLLASGGQPNVS
jgi:hypothetical protein